MEKIWVSGCMPVIPAMVGSLKWEANLGKKQDCISKITRVKRAGGMSQVVDYLPKK
jgi:hypothetical protein